MALDHIIREWFGETLKDIAKKRISATFSKKYHDGTPLMLDGVRRNDIATAERNSDVFYRVDTRGQLSSLLYKHEYEITSRGLLTLARSPHYQMLLEDFGGWDILDVFKPWKYPGAIKRAISSAFGTVDLNPSRRNSLVYTLREIGEEIDANTIIDFGRDNIMYDPGDQSHLESMHRLVQIIRRHDSGIRNAALMEILEEAGVVPNAGLIMAVDEHSFLGRTVYYEDHGNKIKKFFSFLTNGSNYAINLPSEFGIVRDVAYLVAGGLSGWFWYKVISAIIGGVIGVGLPDEYKVFGSIAAATMLGGPLLGGLVTGSVAADYLANRWVYSDDRATRFGSWFFGNLRDIFNISLIGNSVSHVLRDPVYEDASRPHLPRFHNPIAQLSSPHVPHINLHRPTGLHWSDVSSLPGFSLTGRITDNVGELNHKLLDFIYQHSYTGLSQTPSLPRIDPFDSLQNIAANISMQFQQAVQKISHPSSRAQTPVSGLDARLENYVTHLIDQVQQHLPQQSQASQPSPGIGSLQQLADHVPGWGNALSDNSMPAYHPQGGGIFDDILANLQSLFHHGPAAHTDRTEFPRDFGYSADGEAYAGPTYAHKIDPMEQWVQMHFNQPHDVLVGTPPHQETLQGMFEVRPDGSIHTNQDSSFTFYQIASFLDKLERKYPQVRFGDHDLTPAQHIERLYRMNPDIPYGNPQLPIDHTIFVGDVQAYGGEAAQVLDWGAYGEHAATLAGCLGSTPHTTVLPDPFGGMHLYGNQPSTFHDAYTALSACGYKGTLEDFILAQQRLGTTVQDIAGGNYYLNAGSVSDYAPISGHPGAIHSSPVPTSASGGAFDLYHYLDAISQELKDVWHRSWDASRGGIRAGIGRLQDAGDAAGRGILKGWDCIYKEANKSVYPEGWNSCLQ